MLKTTFEVIPGVFFQIDKTAKKHGQRVVFLFQQDWQRRWKQKHGIKKQKWQRREKGRFFEQRRRGQRILPGQAEAGFESAEPGLRRELRRRAQERKVLLPGQVHGQVRGDEPAAEDDGGGRDRGGGGAGAQAAGSADRRNRSVQEPRPAVPRQNGASSGLPRRTLLPEACVRQHAAIVHAVSYEKRRFCRRKSV